MGDSISDKLMLIGLDTVSKMMNTELRTVLCHNGRGLIRTTLEFSDNHLLEFGRFNRNSAAAISYWPHRTELLKIVEHGSLRL